MARPDPGSDLTRVEGAHVAFDGSGFELAYHAHARRLHAAAFDLVRDRDAAQDVVQAALIRVWSAASYHPERGALLPFLIACVRREALDSLRRTERRRVREARAAAGDDGIAVDETAAVDPIEARRVRLALERLTDVQRDVVVRAYYGHRTLAEIAHESDLPLGTVKSRLSQALRRLHALLTEGS